MERPQGSETLLVAGGGTLALLALVLCIPFLALGAGINAAGAPPSPCGESPAGDDGTPLILGPSELSAADLQGWWASSRSGQPARLSVPIDDLIETYLAEGSAEGVRGDLAFAQAVHETGWFTNSGTAVNNFAGIAHYDDASSGSEFSDPLTGVRAQIQLLKKFADGNDAALAQVDVAPDAGAQATTWGQLAGTWASDPGYWDALRVMFQSMKAEATTPGQGAGDRSTSPRTLCGLGAGRNPAVVGGYALPVSHSWWEEHPEWFTKPHHDYPAADIPVPTGTPLYAVTSGTIVSTTTSGRCGYGVILNGDDGAQYTYCHGKPGSHRVSVGEWVSPGQLVMESASTGNSTGPHLHFAIHIEATSRCPQGLFVLIADGTEINPATLPSDGCTT